MKKKQIKDFRMNLGKFWHDYYINFGEEKYEGFVKRIGEAMVKEYGEPFSSDNLRIMEAEYVTFNARLDEKNKSQNKKTST